MKKLVSASALASPVQVAADILTIVDGGAPASGGVPGRSTTYNGPRTNTHDPNIRASSDWRKQPENQPSAGIHTAEGTPIQRPKFDASFLKKEEYRTDPIDWRTGQFL